MLSPEMQKGAGERALMNVTQLMIWGGERSCVCYQWLPPTTKACLLHTATTDHAEKKSANISMYMCNMTYIKLEFSVKIMLPCWTNKTDRSSFCEDAIVNSKAGEYLMVRNKTWLSVAETGHIFHWGTSHVDAVYLFYNSDSRGTELKLWIFCLLTGPAQWMLQRMQVQDVYPFSKPNIGYVWK